MSLRNKEGKTKINYQISSPWLKKIIVGLDFFGYSLEKIFKKNQDKDGELKEALRSQKIKKVLLLKPEGIGDLLCATPAVSAIKRNLPRSTITVLCSTLTAPLLRFNPKVDKVFSLDLFWLSPLHLKVSLKSAWKILKSIWQLRKQHFDLIVDFRGDPRNILFILFLDGKYRLSYINQGLGFLLTNKVLESGEKQHIVERNLYLLGKFFPRPKNPKLELFLDKKSRKNSQKILKENSLFPKDRIIAVHIGFTSPKKAWRIENFLKLIKNLNNLYPHKKIALVGTREDKKNAEALIKTCGSPKVIDLTGKLKLLETAWLIKRSDLTIACDSGLAHMATALGTPVVDLIGPSDPVVWGPYDGERLTLHKNLPCSPCVFKVYGSRCLYRKYRCMDIITTEEVAQKIELILTPHEH